MANLAQQDLVAHRERLDLRDQPARKATEDHLAQLEPQVQPEQEARLA